MSGRVWLVGAGPGDPELLTLRAARLLAEADVVLHDALIPAATLALTPAAARRVCVGKRAGRPSWRQEEIHRAMADAAREGLRVVRLKVGDPYVLGRGGEEALAMAALGIPCEVVPGVTSATAAAAWAGIPVTHRGLASAVLVVSGHAPEAYEAPLGSLAPGSATVVILMGLRTLAHTSALLLARGWSPETPAALVLGAWTEAGVAWRGALAEVADVEPPLGPDAPPGALVIGAVAALTLAGAAEATMG